MSRQSLNELIDQLIPDNNNKEITAANAREVFKAFNDKKFHLDEDLLLQQLYNINQTLEQRLQGLPNERRAILGTYDWTVSTGVEQSLDVFSDPDNIIQNATFTKVENRVLIFNVQFTENIVNKNIDVFHEFESLDNLTANTRILPLSKVRNLVDNFTIRLAQRRLVDGNVGNHFMKLILK